MSASAVILRKANIPKIPEEKPKDPDARKKRKMRLKEIKRKVNEMMPLTHRPFACLGSM